MLKQGVFATASLGMLEPAFGPLAGDRERALGGHDLEPERRNPDLVPTRARAHRDVGRRSVQAGLGLRRSVRAFAAPVVRAVASDRKGTSDPWTAGDIRAARLIRTSISDVVVQFRAVRILIAQDQLDQVSRKVRDSGQQVLVADAPGAVIQSNAGFAEWLGVEPSALQRIDELPRYFDDPDSVRLRLEALVVENRPWRGEAAIVTPHGGAIPVLVRADPVFVTPDRALGFVLLLADLTDSKAAQSARRRFQENILRSQRQFLTVGAGRGVWSSG